MTRQSDLGAILDLLSQSFTDEAINVLAIKLFPNVYNDFTVGMDRTQKIRMIVDYANRQGYLPDLLAYVQKKNKHQYNVYALKLENQHSEDSVDLSYPKIPITSNSMQENTFGNSARTLSSETIRGQNDKVENTVDQELDDAFG